MPPARHRPGRRSPLRPLAAGVAFVVLAVALIAGLSASLAPSALAAFVAAERGLDLTVDEKGASVAWIRPAVSAKPNRPSPAAAPPPPEPAGLASRSAAPGADWGAAAPALPRTDRGDTRHHAASGGLTRRIPTGPPMTRS